MSSLSYQNFISPTLLRRKEDPGKEEYHDYRRGAGFACSKTALDGLMMHNTKPLLSPQSTVADLLARWPQVIPVFLQYHMSCVGCSMAAFETLEDAARIYGINFDMFFNEVINMIEKQPCKSSLQKFKE